MHPIVFRILSRNRTENLLQIHSQRLSRLKQQKSLPKQSISKHRLLVFFQETVMDFLELSKKRPCFQETLSQSPGVLIKQRPLFRKIQFHIPVLQYQLSKQQAPVCQDLSLDNNFSTRTRSRRAILLTNYKLHPVRRFNFQWNQLMQHQLKTLLCQPILSANL